MIIPKNVPARAPSAKMPAFSTLNASTDPETPTKRLTISAVQFKPFEELEGITASQIIYEFKKDKNFQKESQVCWLKANNE